MTPVEPPIVNVNINVSTKNTALVLICNREALVPRYVHNQFKILLPVANDIISVTVVSSCVFLHVLQINNPKIRYQIL